MTKIRPISFSPVMIEAEMDGRKNQTRRLVSPQPASEKWDDEFRGDDNIEPVVHHEIAEGVAGSYSLFDNLHKCPFGEAGDVLWVREEHKIWFKDHGGSEFWYCEFKDGHVKDLHNLDIPPKVLSNLKKRKTLGKWQRARFLPRAFSRTYLMITNVRVERVQSITEDDAMWEGCTFAEPYYSFGRDHGATTHRQLFERLWDSLHGPGVKFRDNPWVWAIIFQRQNLIQKS